MCQSKLSISLTNSIKIGSAIMAKLSSTITLLELTPSTCRLNYVRRMCVADNRIRLTALIFIYLFYTFIQINSDIGGLNANSIINQSSWACKKTVRCAF